MRNFYAVLGDGGSGGISRGDGGTEIISRGDGGSDGISMASAIRPALKASVAFPILAMDSGTQV